MDIKDEIRSRLPIDQLVAQYCQLKKKGRNFVCLCPFHNDNHPSFLVSPDKGIAYCFACRSGGDIFSFIQKIENVDFPEAVKILAEKAGVEIPKEQHHKGPTVTKDEKTRIKDCLDSAQAFYVKKLKDTPAAMQYVVSRGVTPDLMAKFGIGYAPDSFSETYEHLLKNGASRADMISAGVAVQKELEGKVYDRFRHRIMFPIHDPQGIVIGFGGRAMGDSDAKYVNSPEGPLYNKSSVLFGLFAARDAIRKARSVVLVEGYFDAVACHKAGVENVVAVSGTALTEQHVKIIKRYADSVILCLDQDNAGQLAAGRAFDLLCRAHLKILSVSLPAKDPDELIQKDPALFKKLITESAEPYIDSVIRRLKTVPGISEPAGKRIVSDTLFPLLDAVPTSVELRAYLEKAAQAFGIIGGEIQSDFGSWKSGSTPTRIGAKATSGDQKTSGYSGYELCLGIALLYPAVRPLVSELIPSDDTALASLREKIASAMPEAPVTDILAAADMPGERKEQVGVLCLYCEETFPDWSETLAEKEFRKLCASANREIVTRKQMELVRELKEVRSRGRADEEAKLLTQYQQLLKLSKMVGKQ